MKLQHCQIVMPFLSLFCSFFVACLLFSIFLFPIIIPFLTVFPSQLQTAVFDVTCSAKFEVRIPPILTVLLY